jgi:hypothetical protein
MAAQTERVIFRAPTEWLAGLDKARGNESRAAYIRRAVNTLATAEGGGKRRKRTKGGRTPPPPEEIPLPKIAKAHWKP